MEYLSEQLLTNYAFPLLPPQALEGKDIKDLLTNVGSGGAPAAGGGAAAAPAEAGAAEEAKEEKKEEPGRVSQRISDSMRNQRMRFTDGIHRGIR